MAELEQLRAAHMARAQELAPEFLSRLRWSREELAAHQRRALRALLTTAVDRSPWHRKRLKNVDVDALDPADLTALPVMTKADLMSDWDEIVTDDRLRLADVDAHLADAADPGYLFDEYTALASGGSSGRRAVVVYDRDGFALCWLSAFRRALIDRQTDPELSTGAMAIAWVTAAHPSHLSAAAARTFRNPAIVNIACPVTWPLERIVAALNHGQPTVLAGYPSALALLAREAATGQLRISPARVLASGEPLLPEIRSAANAAWARLVLNGWGGTEMGMLGVTCRSGRMHLAEDVGIVEVVDAAGRAVAAGQCGSRIYVTNLFNHALPTIRYEITDELTVLSDACPCGETTRTIADVQGRQDDIFEYGAATVHPHVFRTAFNRRAAILEYQVRQTERGAEVDVRCIEHLDVAALVGELQASLGALGLRDAVVTVRQVDRVNRLEHTGKLKRFVPLATP